MSKTWEYAELSKLAKEAGGPEKYGKLQQRYGFQKGVTMMIPVCALGCIVTYVKGKEIVKFIKEKTGIVTKEDLDFAEKEFYEAEMKRNINCTDDGDL